MLIAKLKSGRIKQIFIKPLIFTGFPINTTIVFIFLFLNPIYALPIATIINLFSRTKINCALAGILYCFSFSLLFFFQSNSSIVGNDIYLYVSMYNVINASPLYTFSNLFERFTDDLIGKEFLWHAYTKIISYVSNANTSFFVFTSFIVMFGLSAYLTFLISSTSNQNYLFFLLLLIYFQMNFQFSTYLVWRHTFASLLFYIGIVLFNKSHSNLYARILIYISPLFHIVMIPMVISFEIYNIIFNQGKYTLMKNNRLMLNLFVALLFVLFLVSIQDYISMYIYSIKNLQSAFAKYLYFEDEQNILKLLSPVSVLLIIYILSTKKLLHFELYIILIYYSLILIPFVIILPNSFIARAFGSLFIIAPLIAGKVLARSGYSGLLVLVFLIIYRFYTFIDPDFIHNLEYVGHGNYLNPFYGIFTMLFFYKAPVYW